MSETYRTASLWILNDRPFDSDVFSQPIPFGDDVRQCWHMIASLETAGWESIRPVRSADGTFAPVLGTGLPAQSVGGHRLVSVGGVRRLM